MEVRCPMERNTRCYRPLMEGAAAATGPEQMRAAMAAYVRAVHQAYLEAAEPMTPGDRARLPLFASDSFTVLAIGTRYLHVLGTTDQLPTPTGQEAQLDDELGDLRWSLRFFDPVITPQLGLIDEREQPEPQQVREALGIRSVVYHLSVPPGGGLTPHHAQHAGTGLAHSHAAADRDFSTMAALVPNRGPIVSEMHVAHTNQMPMAHYLLAQHLVEPAVVTADPTDFAEVRRQTLSELRGASS
jgi:hypothetical protein